nr:hypothetical protein [Micromonospora coriariae]
MDPQLATNPNQVLSNRQRRGVQVDVRPSQAEQFATAEAEHERQDVQGVPAGGLDGFEQPLCLCDGQTLANLVVRCLDLDELGDVADDQFLPERVLKHIPAGSRGTP